MDFLEVLPACYPNSVYTWVGVPTNQEELDESLTWLSDDPKPTWDEIQTAWSVELAARSKIEQDKIDSKNTAMAKLKKLGLTEDEISALIS